jgi:hypothetical protein
MGSFLHDFLVCFLGDSKVRLVNGDTKKISELRSGMKVYSMNSLNEIMEDEVVMMLHLEPNETGMSNLFPLLN